MLDTARVASGNDHGTGCTLSAAIAALAGHGRPGPGRHRAGQGLRHERPPGSSLVAPGKGARSVGPFPLEPRGDLGHRQRLGHPRHRDGRPGRLRQPPTKFRARGTDHNSTGYPLGKRAGSSRPTGCAVEACGSEHTPRSHRRGHRRWPAVLGILAGALSAGKPAPVPSSTPTAAGSPIHAIPAGPELSTIVSRELPRLRTSWRPWCFPGAPR